MQYRKFGRTGLFVSELCLGAMTFGQAEDNTLWKAVSGLDQSAATDMIRTAFDAGVNFIDTADVYTFGQSEEFVGQAIADLGFARDEVVIATKGLGAMGKGPNQSGASRLHLLHAVEQSLKRLKFDHIDLYQIHGFDPATPIEEQLEALDSIVRQGKARYVGVSNWAAWQVEKALGISERKALARFESLQAYYSLGARDLERELVPMLTEERLALMVWSPLSGGFLSGKYRGDGKGRRDALDFPPVTAPDGSVLLDTMEVIAKQLDASMAQVAIAWLLHQRAVTSVIIGASKQAQLADNLGATEVKLSEDMLTRLNDASALSVEYPHYMMEMQGMNRRELLAGN